MSITSVAASIASLRAQAAPPLTRPSTPAQSAGRTHHHGGGKKTGLSAVDTASQSTAPTTPGSLLNALV